MSRLFCLLLMATGVQVAANTVQTVAKRDVQADLSDGFCRNWVFGANIVGDVLYMNGMDGGSLDTDKNASNNYFIKVDLSAPVDLQDGSNYKLSLIPTDVPKLRDQALWSNQANSTLFSYGGRSPNGKNLDAGGVWMYSISDGSWEEQKTSVEPVRLIEGAYVNVPELQAAYYLGGYQTKQTTSSITDGTKSYATGMIQYNTTTMEYTMLEAPFTPVQQGALVYLPARDKGALVFLGGEVPASKDGIDTEITPNSWDYVQVYDIEAGVWYKQTTTGDVARRTQFCASVMHDPSSESFQIYVISGADYESKEIVKDVSYLSIPSFKWYRAAGLAKGRMSHTCQAYGRQILGVGGRQSYVPISDPKAGCYKTPAFLYDAQSELVRKTFDPALLSYSIPSNTAGDIQNSPTPSVWDNPSLAFLLTDRSNNNTSTKETQTKPTNKGAIAGGVVGGVAGAAVILGLIWFSLRSRRRKAQQDDTEQPETSERKLPILGELSANQVLRELSTSQSRVEVGSHGSQLYELDGGQTQQSQSQKQSMDRRSEERPEQ